jgi:signal transduction histidine kinase
VDVLLAALVAGIAEVDAVSAGRGAVDHALLLVAAFSLIQRHRMPRVVLVICLGCVLTYAARGEGGIFAGLPVLVAVYAVVAAGRRLLGAIVTAALVAGGIGSALRDGAVTQEALLPVGWFVATFLLGEVARHRAELLRAAELRAAEAERTREEVAARRAVAERLRIARELHDSLTHSISVIKVRAGVAVHLARKRGEEVPEALLAIQEASGDAARELRETLDVLRVERDGLDRLPELLDRTRETGLKVTVTTTGTPYPLPSDVDQAAYRIVQEALTNVTRHAEATSATVTLDYGTPFTVRVDDDGAGTTEPAGFGITGMRERAAELGGRLVAEPREGGGFTVRAEL